MRLSHLLLPAAALALAPALAGCGTDSLPPTADAAWYIQMIQTGTCQIQGHDDQLGAVTSTDRTKVITDQVDGGNVTCTVSGTGKFDVSATTTYKDLSLSVNISGLSKSATADKPVKGNVTYASTKTIAPYAGECQFFFEGTKEAIAAGKVWVSFICEPGLTNSSSATGSTCEVKTGYLLLENCETEVTAEE